MIRDRSAGRRSLDDVMRSLAAQFSPARGIGGSDIERAVATACACDAQSFFSTYVRGAGPLDFNRWLGIIGLRATVTWAPVRLSDSTPAPDLRLLGYALPSDPRPRLLMWFPSTAWGQAGFHTGDRIVSWNRGAVSDVPQLRAAIGRLGVGDTVHIAVQRDSGPYEATVTVAGYNRPVVHIAERPDATAAQRALLTRWLAGQ
jgi:predicted metalloprotease with PDZ domain